MKRTHVIISALAISLLACQKDLAMAKESTVKEEVYGKMPDGKEVKIYTLTNKNGLVAKVTEYGAILVSMETPDKDGKIADLTHGYDSLAGWLTNTSYFGATVGRFGNRIKDGKFTLDGKEYKLATNNDPAAFRATFMAASRVSTRCCGPAKRLATASNFPISPGTAKKGIPAICR